VDCRDVGADKDGDDEDGEEMEGAAPAPDRGLSSDVVGAADLGPRDEAPRLLVWAAGAAWLISCSVARPGLVACLGCAWELVGASRS
jgi:hypothetical protein